MSNNASTRGNSRGRGTRGGRGGRGGRGRSQGPAPTAPNPQGAGFQSTLQGFGRGRAPQSAPTVQNVSGAGGQPVPPVPVPAGTGTVVAPSSRFSSFAAAATHYAPTLNPGSPAINKLKSKGIPVQEAGESKQEVSKHLVSACVREVAEVRAMGVASKFFGPAFSTPGVGPNGVLTERTIVSLFGANRDVRLAVDVNKGVPTAEKVWVLTHRPVIVSEDLTRTTEVLAVPQYAQAVDYALQQGCPIVGVDIYALGVHALTPQSVADLLGESLRLRTINNPQRFIWVGQRFDGPAGTMEGEGAWRRVPRGIEYRSDPTHPIRGPHDSCDWIWNKSVAEVQVAGAKLWLAWVVLEKIGNHHIVQFQLIDRALVDTTVSHPNVKFQALLVPSATKLTRLIRLLGMNPWSLMSWSPLVSKWFYVPFHATVLFSSSLLDQCRSHLSLRSITELALKQSAKKLETLVAADESMQTLWRNFPDLRQHEEMMVLALYHHYLETQTPTLCDFVADTASTASAYNSALASVSTPPVTSTTASSGWWMAGAVVAGVSAFALHAALKTRLSREAPFKLTAAFEPVDPDLAQVVLNNMGQTVVISKKMFEATAEQVRLQLDPSGAFLGEDSFLRGLTDRVVRFGSGLFSVVRAWIPHARPGVVVKDPFEAFYFLGLSVWPVCGAPVMEESMRFMPFGQPYTKWIVSATLLALENWTLFWTVGAMKCMRIRLFANSVHLLAPFLGFKRALAWHVLVNLFHCDFAQYISLRFSINPVWDRVARFLYGPFWEWQTTYFPQILREWEGMSDDYVRALVQMRETVVHSVKPTGTSLAIPTLWGVALSCAVIALWTWTQQKPAVAPFWKTYVKQYYVDPWEHRPSVFRLAQDVRVEHTGRIVRVPTQRAFCPIPLLASNTELKGEWQAFQWDQDLRERTFCWWPILQANAFYAPARTDYNLLMVAMVRICAEPPLASDDQAQAWFQKMFQMAANVKRSNFDKLVRVARQNGFWWCAVCPDPDQRRFIVYIPKDSAEYVAHFTSFKKRRAEQAAKEIEQLGMGLYRTSLNGVALLLKTDELLFKVDEDGFPQMKPRAIANVNPRVAAVQGPEVWTYQKRLMAVWDVDTPLEEISLASIRHLNLTFPRMGVERVLARLTFASGRTDKDLSEWYNCVLEQSESLDLRSFAVWILVAGDDTLCLIRWVTWDSNGLPQVKFFLIEGDISMCDQSSQAGPLFFESVTYARGGMDPEIAWDIYEFAHAPYTGTSRDMTSRFKVEHFERPMRHTGGNNTTTGNSTNVGLGLLTGVLGSFPDFAPDSVQTKMMELGFKMKIKVFSGKEVSPLFDYATFLKGMWYPVLSAKYDRYWAPLPSRLLKATKSLKNPQIIYGVKDEVTASRAFMADMALNYGSFLHIPILRVLNRFARFHLSRKVQLEEWQIQASPADKPLVDEQGALFMITQRYGFSCAEVRDFERRFPVDVCWFIQHPVLLALALTDYA